MPDSKRTTERRRGTRFRSRTLADGAVAASAATPGRSFLGATVNVSKHGSLLRTYEALRAGEAVALRLHLPEGELAVDATVLHVAVDAVGCRLAGVRFGALSDAGTKLLDRHLAEFTFPRDGVPWPFEGHSRPWQPAPVSDR